MHQNLFVTQMSKQDVNSTLTIMKILLQNGNVTKVCCKYFAESTLLCVLHFIDSRYYAYFSTSVCHMWLQHLWSTSWVSIGKRTLFVMCAGNWLALRWWYSPTMTLTAFALPLEDDECRQLTMEFLWFMWSHRQPWHWPTISLYRPYHWCCQYSPWVKTLSSFYNTW